MQSTQSNNLFGETIFTYPRAEALEDGMLVDVTETAYDAGFRFPVAITHTVWDKYVEWTDEDTHKQTYQDQSGRLWDVLWMLYLACRRNGTSSLCYKLHAIPRNGRSKTARMIKLKAVIARGDNGEPVFTIMLPDEN